MMNLLRALFLGLIFSVSSLSAQVYVLFNPDCMKHLEYRYAGQSSQSTGILTYSVRQNADDLYLLDMGAEGNKVLGSLPRGTVNCQDMRFNDEVVRRINQGTLKVNVLRKTQEGYRMSTVAGATQVLRRGTYYSFLSHNFAFSMDTTNLNYENNLASYGTGAYVFYNGLNYSDCHPVYTFRREPDEVCTAKSDFDFLPGLGMMSERTGMTTAEALENEYKLVRINGLSVDSYLQNSCLGRPQENTVSTSAPAAVTYGTVAPPKQNVIQNVVEPNKEDYSISQNQGVAPAEYAQRNNLFVGPKAMINCPERPGEGYHIVQPGETLNGIARAYNVKVGALVTWNSLKDPDILQPCQKIYLTTPPGGLKSVDNSGRVVIAKDNKATKSSKKSKKKSKPSPAPATYSTDNEALAAAQAVQPQNVYWTQQAPQAQIQYVEVPKYIYVREEDSKPVQYNEQTSFAARQEVKPTIANAGIVHVVREGESLYSIAKLYGYQVDRFRKMNGLPENFVLQPGMELVTSDCSCDVTQRPKNLELSSSSNQAVQYSYYSDQNTPPKRTLSNAKTDEVIRPDQYTSPSGTFQETDIRSSGWKTQSAKGSTSAVAPSTYSNDDYGVRRNAAGNGGFREHVVGKDETLGSIAQQYQVSVEDLAGTNSLEKTETLIVGMKLLIPRK